MKPVKVTNIIYQLQISRLLAGFICCNEHLCSVEPPVISHPASCSEDDGKGPVPTPELVFGTSFHQSIYDY